MNRSSHFGAAGGYESAGGSSAARAMGENSTEAVAPVGSVVSLSEIRTARRDGAGDADANSAADSRSEGAEMQESLGVMSTPGMGIRRESGAHAKVFTVAVEHHFPGVGRYSRLLSVSSAMSVADFADVILASFLWPERVNRVPEAHPTCYGTKEDHAAGDAEAGSDTGPAWSFRARTAGRVRVYAKGANSIGTALGDIFRRGTIGVLKVDGYDFSVTVTDTTTRHDEIEFVDPPRDSHFDPFLASSQDLFGAPGEANDEAVLLAADFLADSDDEAAETDDVKKNQDDEFVAHLHPAGIPAMVDISEVNVALAGEDTVENILAEITPELRELLRDGALYEFIPLLQALDLERPANVTEHAAELLADVPIEKSKIGRAAAWARIIALSTLVESEAGEVSEAFMSALGYTRADAKLPPTDTALGADALSASEIKWLSRRTGRILAQVGACKWEPQPDDQAVPLVPQCSMLERLEMYRFILQH